ncbi:hypothetical protein LBA_01074 [Megavirus lba]|uniref:Uncharacterized protein n=1 Tax=Megavirus lba TaxID=1235314 RepID=L7Y4C5_9VIRU|nr:hypothetical protein LBA_01074 [Megavirus lba]
MSIDSCDLKLGNFVDCHENQNDDIESKYITEYSKKQLEEKYIEEDSCLRDAYKYLTNVEKEIFMSMKSDKKNRVKCSHSIDEIMEKKNLFTHDFFLVQWMILILLGLIDLFQLQD